MMGENFSENVEIEAPAITTPDGEATSGVYNRLKENVTGEVKNVEDIIAVKEINDRRININREVNIEEIDSREIDKEVKLRKEKLNGKEINQNNFEKKVEELGDGQATSDVDSHTRKPALEGKILEIIKCKEFMAAKSNEATSEVGSTRWYLCGFFTTLTIPNCRFLSCDRRFLLYSSLPPSSSEVPSVSMKKPDFPSSLKKYS
ncbi:hypothetical protein M0802_014937 [Mischocyttarus mexicanus]|nr:hypothetical protein M0802_014937 [Mischocyttarus mexicanus]